MRSLFLPSFCDELEVAASASGGALMKCVCSLRWNNDSCSNMFASISVSLNSVPHDNKEEGLEE